MEPELARRRASTPAREPRSPPARSPRSLTPAQPNPPPNAMNAQHRRPRVGPQGGLAKGPQEESQACMSSWAGAAV